MVKKPHIKGPFDDVITWVGSTSSFVLHTLVFVLSFIVVLLGWVELSRMLLILTTAVSLEAIYLAIFIQMSVNRNTLSLREVEEDIDEIGDEIDELSEDIDEIGEEIDELSEDDKEEEVREKQQSEALDQLTTEVHRLLDLVETLKKK